MRLNPQLEPGVRRTLERRVRDWRAQHGPQQEVIFRQRQEPGRMGISDFTDMNRIGVTIGGCKFDHKLYHFRLAWSGFTHVGVVQGGESFAALGQGLQDALWTLGGAPRECRTDSLSAAFRNISKDDGEDLTESYRQLCEHYGMQATRNNRGVAHENGAIEGPHGHLKRAVEDALALRGSKDFETLDEYRDLIAQITGNINLRHSKKIEAEREVLRALPGRRTTDYKETSVRVTRFQRFSFLRKVFYTVPSRLIGHRLGVRLYADRVELYLGSRHQLTLPRGHHHSSSRHWCAQCGQLSSCDSFSEAQADGADELGLPRSAVSARGVSTLFRGGTGAHHATASLSGWRYSCCRWLTTTTAKPGWRSRSNNACGKERFRMCLRCKSNLPCNTVPCRNCMWNRALWPAMRRCCSKELSHECQASQKQPFDRCSQNWR